MEVCTSRGIMDKGIVYL